MDRTTGPFIIDGKLYPCANSVYKCHLYMGGSLRPSAIHQRLKSGLRTWSELNAPANPVHFATGRTGGLTTSAKRKAAKTEMSALLRELDERKRKISSQT